MKIQKISLLNLFFILIFCFSFIDYNHPNKINNNNFYQNHLNLSIISDKIIITGNQGWINFRSLGKCTGQGTATDPYIIKDLEINAGGSGSGITIISSTVYFVIQNCTLTNSEFGNYGGIELNNVTNGKLVNNTLSYNDGFGIRVIKSSYNNITGNTANHNTFNGLNIAFSAQSQHNYIEGNKFQFNEYGMIIDGSNNTILNNYISNSSYDGLIIFGHDNFVTKNIFVNCTGVGIRIQNAINNKVSGNSFSDNGDSIIITGTSTGNIVAVNKIDGAYTPINIGDLGDGDLTWSEASAFYWCSGSGTINDPYIIQNMWINGSRADNTILIKDSNVYFEIRYCNITYSKLDFLLPEDNYAGVRLQNIQNGKIYKNNILYNHRGIFIQNSANTIISGNKINNNNAKGIFIVRNSENITISDNIIQNNTGDGIFLHYNTDYSTIEDNYIYNNKKGIRIHDRSDFNNIHNNMIIQNKNDGIYLWSESNYNIITDNLIKENLANGVYIDDGGVVVESNTIYNNSFINNIGANARSDSFPDLNSWNLGTLGNLWNDYTGSDNNEDGIGDDPYSISGFSGDKDYYPIWPLPQITINYPQNEDLFGSSAPNYELTIYGKALKSMWYSLDDGLTKINFTKKTGMIDQVEWEKIGNGTATIQFFVQNLIGSDSFEVSVRKDIIVPNIIINTPTPNLLCGINAPTFDVTVNDPNLEEKWYSLNNGQNITYTTNFQFDETEWKKIGNGTVLIKFYAKDKAGNINSSEVIIRKDAYIPSIMINSPLENDLFEDIAPFFNVEIIDSNLDKMWYTIDDGLTNVTFTTNNSIDQILWNLIDDGIIILTFYANDTVGNINFRTVNIIKDTTLPVVNIIFPSTNDVFGAEAPNFVISIIEPNLNLTWYTLNNGRKYPITNTTGAIDQEAWSACGNGTVTIHFYANDTLNHIGFTEVIVQKEIISPVWNLIPQNQIIELGDDLYYELDAYDLSGIDYWWINDTLIYNIDTSGIVTNIIPLSIGQKWLEIRAYDPFGNYCNASIRFTVQDTTVPTWIVLPTDQVIEFGDDFFYELDAYDLSGIDHWWINDTLKYQISNDGIITNIIPLSAGQKWLEIRAYDPFGNYCNALIKITIEARINPSGIPGYNVFLITGVVFIISIIYYLEKKKKN